MAKCVLVSWEQFERGVRLALSAEYFPEEAAAWVHNHSDGTLISEEMVREFADNYFIPVPVEAGGEL